MVLCYIKDKGIAVKNNLRNEQFTLSGQSVRMPVLFTSHGSPMDIPLSKEEKPFWNSLFELGKELQHKYEIKAALIVSAHWCTQGTFVNSSQQQTQIYDYYGFPDEYYQVNTRQRFRPRFQGRSKGSILL